jgi:SPP1 family predicted phage head-tail adaptor
MATCGACAPARKPAIDPRKLDQRITLQSRATGVDALGQESPAWADLPDVPEVWAQAITKRGREYFAAGSVQADAGVVFRIRYRADVLLNSATLRVVWRGVPYDIVEPPQDIDGQREAVDLVCSTGARDGR